MHAFGLSRCLYLVSCKDDDTLYAERIEYDPEFCLRLLARLERIINSPEPPSRINEAADWFECTFCKHKPGCKESAWPRVTCRSCIHSSPEMGGDGHWSCARWAKPISFDEQKEGCPTHLTIPALVPGEQTDCSEEDETITYVLRDGTIYVDGATTA
jgi:hypothetical protein